MSKKKKKRAPKKNTAKQKQTAPAPKKMSKYPLLAMIAGGILVLGGVFFLYQGEKPSAQYNPEPTEVKKANFNLRENRPTLSPERFSGKVKKAYTIARTIPEVLDQLYCYCRCRENFGHKNLLSCFVDTHAST
jgi:hypothetical protein